jgi:lysophospholipase L1-like esterase
LSGADIERVAAHTVGVANDAVPGAQSNAVVDQLQRDRAVMTDVEGSEAVFVEVGANDVAHSSKCGNAASCYEAEGSEIEHNLAAIVHDIHELRKGHEIAVVLLGYWSVWLGGEYARAQGPDYVAAADTVTENVNDAIESVAHSTGSIYVDLRRAFRGPDDAWDETHLLAPDGDHPDAEGHERIAQAIAYTVTAH